MPIYSSRFKELSPRPNADKWEYLSGIVDTTQTITLGASLHSIGRYLFDLEVAFIKRENIDNQIGLNNNDGRFLLKAQYQF